MCVWRNSQEIFVVELKRRNATPPTCVIDISCSSSKKKIIILFVFVSPSSTPIRYTQVVQPISRLRLLRIMIASVPAVVPTQQIQVTAIVTEAVIGHWKVRQHRVPAWAQLSLSHPNRFQGRNWRVRHCQNYHHHQYVCKAITIDAIFAPCLPMYSG